MDGEIVVFIFDAIVFDIAGVVVFLYFFSTDI